MRVYYDKRGRVRGRSMSGTESYVYQVFQVAGYLILAGFVLIAVAAVLALLVVLGALGVLYWSIGWLVGRHRAWAESGRRMRQGSGAFFAPLRWLSRGKQRVRRGASDSNAGTAERERQPNGDSAQADAATSYSVRCPQCSGPLVSSSGRNIKCPGCGASVNITPWPPERKTTATASRPEETQRG